LVRRLADLVREIRSAASENDGSVDLNRFNSFLDQAAAANQSADYAQAIRQYCFGINFILGEMKRAGKKK
jgi:hypothetical protein